MEEIKSMRALSIQQPWAECIISHGKNVENRGWNTVRRGYFAVHASASTTQDRFDACLDLYGIELNRHDLAYGAIVGFADLRDVITTKTVNRLTKKWYIHHRDNFGFVLRGVIRLETPVPVKGALNFWVLKGQPLRACLKQLGRRDLKVIAEGLLE